MFRFFHFQPELVPENFRPSGTTSITITTLIRTNKKRYVNRMNRMFCR